MKGLYLDIQTCHCSCGNSWTHSRPVLYAEGGSVGGTPSPQEEMKLPVLRLMHARRDFHHCFRCAPLGLGVGWSRSEVDLTGARAPSPSPSAKQSLAVLEDDIFN
jgi:hypothetical protein